jgi:hypothetical protein
LGRVNHLAEGVAYENRARHLFAEEVAGMGQDGGHASAHVVATDNGRVPDLNASGISDCIRRKDADLQPKVMGTGCITCSLLCD